MDPWQFWIQWLAVWTREIYRSADDMYEGPTDAWVDSFLTDFSIFLDNTIDIDLKQDRDIEVAIKELEALRGFVKEAIEIRKNPETIGKKFDNLQQILELRGRFAH